MEKFFEKIYGNIGVEIKKLAKLISALLAILAILGGIGICVDTGTPAGIFLIIIGPILACIFALPLYGFGELIETNQKIKELNKEIAKNTRVIMIEMSNEKRN